MRSNNCEPICGDAILIKSEKFTEECDDGNLSDLDGCSKECKLEENQ